MSPGRSLLAHGSNMIHNHYIGVMGTLVPEVDCNKDVSILARRSERRHLLRRRIPLLDSARFPSVLLTGSMPAVGSLAKTTG